MRLRRVLAIVMLLAAAGCAAAPAPPPDVALGAPANGVTRPVDGSELVPGATYRFPDLLPGLVGVDVPVAVPPVFTYSGPTFAFFSGDQLGNGDLVTFAAADEVALWMDPYREQPPTSEEEAAARLVMVAPGALLSDLAVLPFLEVVVPERPMVVAGVDGTALDVRVPDLPPGTPECYSGLPPCADLFAVPDHAQAVFGGQELRFAQLDLPAGRIFVVQNLQDPRAQDLVDAARFVERPRPAVLGDSRVLPYTAGPLEPGASYGTVLDELGIGVTFTASDTPQIGLPRSPVSSAVVTADVPRDARTGGRLGFQATTEHLIGYVTSTVNLLVPEPGVDPRAIGVAALEQSLVAADDPGGLLGVIATQPWAEVRSAPADAVVGGWPGRSMTLRLREGAGPVPCVPGEPPACAVLFYSRAHPSLWLLVDRELVVSEVTVGRETLTVVTGTDAAGRAYADSLRLLELGP